jgi:integrase/recombinase XerD
MQIDEAVTAFLDHRKLRGVKPKSLEKYGFWLQFWRDWRNKRELPTDITQIDMDELRAFFRYASFEHVPHQQNTQRPATKRHGLAANSVSMIWRILRAFWNFLDEEGVILPHQRGFFKGGRIPCPPIPDTLRDSYSDELIEKLLTACECNNPESHYRNQAIILLLLESGMRVGELCSLRDQDVDLKLRQAKIIGKGDRMRYVFWGPKAGHVLLMYLRHRRGEQGGPLLRGIGSKNDGGAITANSVRGLFRRLSRTAGVELPPNAPVHGLRHWFAHKALDKGIDVLHLQQLLGHTSVTTTQLYVREHPDRLRAIHQQIWRNDNN